MDHLMKKAKKIVKDKSLNEIQKAIHKILYHIGEDPQRPGLEDTPNRMIRSWEELLGGYNLNPSDIIKVFDSEGYDEMILLRNVEFNSMCEHHFLAFSGIAHVAYIPNKKILGISKIARLVDMFSRRLQVQERLTMQIADTLFTHLAPLGVGVVLEASHSCMGCRGIKSRNASMVTSTLRGCFLDRTVREEFLKLVIR
jgi:GTP cyclohydrolase I